MSSYGSLANCYDKLTTDVNYKEWANYLHNHLQKHPIPGKILLDLACGTGSLTFALADLGYEMIGADLSPDMLSQAMEKSYDYVGQRPIFLCQSMDELDLYGTIDGCVCCLDSINYIIEPETLKKAFEKVSLFLMPKGLFIFDIKTPYALQKQNGFLSLDETEDVYCVWRTETQGDIAQHFLDIFQKEGDLWSREEEHHHQRLYQPDMLVEFLEKAGFSNIRQLGNLSQDSPTPKEERIFFLAEKLPLK